MNGKAFLLPLARLLMSSLFVWDGIVHQFLLGERGVAARPGPRCPNDKLRDRHPDPNGIVRSAT